MKNNSFYQLAGIAGITSALLFMISIIGMQSYISSSLDDVHAFTQNMIDSHHLMLMYGWPGLFATLLILPFVYAFHLENSKARLLSKMLFLTTIIGLGFILVGYLFHLALTYFYAPIYQAAALEQQASMDLVIKTTIGLQDMFWLSGDLFSFLGIAALLLLGWQQSRFPKWFLLIGITSGILAAVVSISFIPAFKQVPGLGFLFIGGFSIFAVWEIIGGLFLLRLHKESTAVPAIS